MDLAVTTYAEVVSFPGGQQRIPLREEGAGIAKKEYHPWLLDHILEALRYRKFLAEIETGFSNPVEVMPSRFSIQDISSSLEMHPKMVFQEKRCLERRIYRLSLSPVGKEFLEHLSSIASKVILSIRKVDELVQVIVEIQGSKKKIEKERFPLGWTFIDTVIKCDHIIKKIITRKSFLSIRREHPQKEEIVHALRRLTVCPTGQMFLQKLQQEFEGRVERIEIRYKKNEKGCSLNIQQSSKIFIWIDLKVKGVGCSVNHAGDFIPAKELPEVVIVHELLHALNTLLRCKHAGQREELKKKKIEEVTFSPLSKSYYQEDLPSYYQGFQRKSFEEQQVIIGALDSERKQLYPITENAVRFCFSEDLRINHYQYMEKFHHGKAFQSYTRIQQPFDFFGEPLCGELEAAILKMDREAITVFLSTLEQKAVSQNLEAVVCSIATLTSFQREVFYEVVEEVFEKYKPQDRAFGDLLHLPLRGAIHLMESTDIKQEEAATLCRLFSHKRFVLRDICSAKEALVRLRQLLPDRSFERKRVEQLLHLADRYQQKMEKG